MLELIHKGELMKIIIIILSLLVSTITFAGKINYPAVIATKTSASTVTFKECFNKNTCRVIMEENIYDLKDLAFSPNLRRLRAGLTATGEVAVGVVVGFLVGTAVAYSAVGLAIGEAGMWIVSIAAGTAVGGSPIILQELFEGLEDSSIISAINPVRQWKMGGVEARIHEDNFSDASSVVIEFKDDIKMLKFINVLKKVLRAID